MADEKAKGSPARPHGGLFGSLKQALAAADSTADSPAPAKASKADADGAKRADKALGAPAAAPALPAPAAPEPAPPPAREAAREARGGTPNIPPVERHVEFSPPPTTRVVKAAEGDESTMRTELVRGKQQVKRGSFHQDPVVGWLVIVGGPGLGAYRPIYEGNNTLGRSAKNRIPIDFGDDAISAEEQAYIRYDSADRTFLFVPNLSKTNVVSLNEKKPTSAVALAAMDVLTMGRTQLVFVPFCGPEFDWSELTDTQS